MAVSWWNKGRLRKSSGPHPTNARDCSCAQFSTESVPRLRTVSGGKGALASTTRADQSHQGKAEHLTPQGHRLPVWNGRPSASKNSTLLPAACGEKNLVTLSSKNVRPVAPSLNAYARPGRASPR